MDVTQILLNAQHPDKSIREVAEKQLQMFEAQDLPGFLVTLAGELGNNEKNSQARVLAGIILKNALDAKDEARKAHLVKQWLSLTPDARSKIKALIWPTLATPIKEPRQISAQVTAKIALVELPHNMWPDLIATLLNNMTINNDLLKQSTLETLGYICEEISPDVMGNQSNQVLMAVIQGMRREEQNNDVKLAAAKALYNALEFVKANFSVEGERNFIMQVVLENTQVGDSRVRVASFECLVKIATHYYNVLVPYMQSIFNVTVQAIQKDEEPVAQQAIEFWSTVCDEEIYLLEEAEEAALMKRQPEGVCHKFVQGALQFLVQVLTQTLTKQDEDADEDTWNSAMAAGTCLALVAATVGDAIVEHVMPFVQQNINNPNWRYREAATLAFGSVLEGPKNFIKPLITQALPVLLSHMKDENESVKDTTAWTLGRICQLHKDAIGEHFNLLIQSLNESLKDVPKVAANVCWAIHNLAQPLEDEEEGNSPLSPYFQHLVTVLLQTIDREDTDEANLLCSAYESLNVLIQNVNESCLPMIQALLPVLVERLEKTFAFQVVNLNDKEAQSEAQALLCSVITVSVQRLGDTCKQWADRMMSAFIQVFQNKNASVHEETLMAVGAVANAIEADFDKYMQHTHLRQFLYLGLREFQAHQVCSVAVGVVGDICRAIGIKVLPYCDDIVSLLLQDLKDPQLDKSVKPPILSCFGDIALAISGNFEKYLQVVITVLQQASATSVPLNDYDLIDYLNQLREGIFEAYTGIIQGLRSDNKSNLIIPHVNNIISFIAHVSTDNTRNDVVTRGAVGVLGDLAHSLGNKIKPQLQQEWVLRLITECLHSESSSTQDVAQWAQEVIGKL